MQVILIVHCTKGGSLRDAVVAGLDRMVEPELIVSEEKRADRNPGWTKIHSADYKRGALNITWSPASWTLEGRVVTRAHARPARSWATSSTTS